nr:formin-like protein 6 [Aegilops tauschii subsp. strangulata]
MAAPPRPVSPAHTRTHGRGSSPGALRPFPFALPVVLPPPPAAPPPRHCSRVRSPARHSATAWPPASSLAATAAPPGPPLLAAPWPAPTHRATPPPPPPLQLAHAATRLTSDASPGRRLAAVAQLPRWPHPGQRPHARTLTGLCPQRPNARAPVMPYWAYDIWAPCPENALIKKL